jgi:ATP-dependent Clp protease adapter protein ClpS
MRPVVTATVQPGVADPVTEDHVEQQIDVLFGDRYAVIIMDSDDTTFAEVERACVELFGYTGSDAAALAMRVHTTGEALAAVMGQREARAAVRTLHRRNVRARSEKL